MTYRSLGREISADSEGGAADRPAPVDVPFRLGHETVHISRRIFR